MAIKQGLTPVEIETLNNIFNKNGYVLDFTNKTFTSFFDYFNINIDDEKYLFYGSSKGKKFRRFLEIETDKKISAILKELIKKLSNIDDVNKVKKIIKKLENKQNIFDKDLNLKNDIEQIKKSLHKYTPISDIISYRLDEIMRSYNSDCYFSVIILSGSILEGILYSVANKFPKQFNQAKSTPKINNKPKEFNQWKLNDFINVASEIKFIDLFGYEYAKNLREFRNFIHPYEAYSKEYNIFDERSAEISIKVLIKIIEDLNNKLF